MMESWMVVKREGRERATNEYQILLYEPFFNYMIKRSCVELERGERLRMNFNEYEELL